MASWAITQPRRLDIEEDVTRLDVSMLAGKLSVVGTDGPARVEISAASEHPLNVKVVDGMLSVRHDVPNTWPALLQPLWWWLNGRHRFAADVSIAIPYRTPAVLRLASGSVVASTVHADLTVEVASGRTTLLGIDGRLRASVVSGPIEALGCAGDISLETVSGEITVADAAAYRLFAKTISGAVTADLDNPPHDSQINLETVSGEITIRVREDSDLSVQLAATGGRLTSAFADVRKEGPWGSARGVLGNGTGKLYASAVSGSVALLWRPVDNDFANAEDGQ